tara:strand:+ start:138 stop:494 length:357 start_codon:yes stop_codon:yes gene_type:complete
MKIEAIEILKQAYRLRKEGFMSHRFVELYHEWCDVTDYKNIDSKHFRFQVMEHGAPIRKNEKYLRGMRRDAKNLFKVSNRMLDPENIGDFIEKQDLGSGFVEKHREDLMRRMFRGSRS